MIGLEPKIGENLFSLFFGISFIFKVDNTSAGRKFGLLGDTRIPGEHATGPDMVHIVRCMSAEVRPQCFLKKLVIEQADLYRSR